jgi:probable non-F420 flavinoid oxidoreductase
MSKATIGFHASHEQFTPSRLLRLASLAKEAGFQAGMCSDHFNPWGERQGQSGVAWSWLGAAMQAVPGWTFGMVNAPGQRYHPAIVAQAAATLGEMFPGRLWCAFGSGQFLNEHVTGQPWPTKAERNERLRESVEVMRALWRGETVTHRGRYFAVEEAKLYTRPAEPPRVYGAALTEETARFVGSWADGLITVHAEPENLRKIVAAFREGGGAGKPMSLQVHVAYAPTDDEARRAAHAQWRNNAFPSKLLSDVKRPDQFDVLGEKVRVEDMDQSVRISSDVGRHVAWLEQDIAAGFDHLYLHEAGPEQERFIEVFGERVLPRLARA